MRRRRFVRRKVLLILLILLILLRKRRPSTQRKNIRLPYPYRKRRRSRNSSNQISIRFIYPKTIPLQWPTSVGDPLPNRQLPLSSFPSPNSTTTNLNAGMDVRSISTANTSPLSNTLSYTSDPTQLTNVPVTNISSSTASAISNDPYAWPPSHVVEKECCGNILITDQQSHIQIWEMEVNSLNTLVQLSLFSSPGSTDVLNVDIQGLDKKELTVTPGNTVNFIGQSIHSIRLSAHGDKQMYIEGKYVVSTTVQIEGKRDPFYIEEKKVNSSDG